MASKRIMNEDVVYEIMTYLDIKDLFRIRTVSFQFYICVELMLNRCKGLVLGVSLPLNCQFYSMEKRQRDLVQCYDTSLVTINTLSNKLTHLKRLTINADIDCHTIESFLRNHETIDSLAIGYEVLITEIDKFLEVDQLLVKRITRFVLHIETVDEDQNLNISPLLQKMPNLKILSIHQTLENYLLVNTLDCIPNKVIELGLHLPYGLGDFDSQSFIDLLYRLESPLQVLSTNHDFTYEELPHMKIKCRLKKFHFRDSCIFYDDDDDDDEIFGDDCLADILQFMNTQRELKHVSIECYHEINYGLIDGYRLLEDIRFAFSFDHIQHLKISGSVVVEKLELYRKVFPNIHVLDLDVFAHCFCSQPDHNYVCKTRFLNVLKTWNRLKRLYIHYCSKFKLNGVEEFPDLQVLHLFDKRDQYKQSVFNGMKRLSERKPNKWFTLGIVATNEGIDGEFRAQSPKNLKIIFIS